MARELIDQATRIGERIGLLTAIDYLGPVKVTSGGRTYTRHSFKFLCDCGNVVEREYSLIKAPKGAKSCGCLQSSSKMLPEGEASRRAMFRQYAASAQARGIGFNLSYEEFGVITQMECAYCGRGPFRQMTVKKHSAKGRQRETSPYACSGVDRIDNSIGYTIENSTACCSDCNFMKGTKDVEQFLDAIERIHRHNES